MDPIVGGAVVGAAGSLIGGFMSGSAQAQANRTNLRIAREQMAFAEGQTAKQMEFQERMSSTAHQREVSDLKAAGLNPMLGFAKGLGGSSSPAGAAASPVPVRVDPANKLQGLQSALQVARQIAELKSIEADIGLKQDQKFAAYHSGRQSAAVVQEIQAKLAPAVDNLVAQGDLTRAQAATVRAALPLVTKEIAARISRDYASAREAGSRATLNELEAKYYIPYFNSALGVLRTIPGFAALRLLKGGAVDAPKAPIGFGRR